MLQSTFYCFPKKMGEPGGLVEVESALYASKSTARMSLSAAKLRAGHKRAASTCLEKCGDGYSK
ncbi:MAG: hypothetical protein ACLTSM_01770 [Eubacterium sp.]